MMMHCPAQPELVIYTRPRCPLCDEAREAVARCGLAHLVEVRTVDIFEDQELLEEYRWEVPVLEMGGRQLLKGRVSPGQVRQKLLEVLAGGEAVS